MLNLHLTAIDNKETLFPEDGFAVDLKTKNLFVAATIPDLKQSFLPTVRRTLLGNASPGDKIFFSRYARRSLSFSPIQMRPALIMRLNADQKRASMMLGYGKIQTKMNYDDEAPFDNLELAEACSHCERYADKKPKDLGTLVSQVLDIFNHVAEDAMRSRHIPFLGRGVGIGTRKLLISGGTFRINRPLRDVVSLVNSLQLTHYLRYGDILFSKEDLWSYI